MLTMMYRSLKSHTATFLETIKERQKKAWEDLYERYGEGAAYMESLPCRC